MKIKQWLIAKLLGKKNFIWLCGSKCTIRLVEGTFDEVVLKNATLEVNAEMLSVAGDGHISNKHLKSVRIVPGGDATMRRIQKEEPKKEEPKKEEPVVKEPKPGDKIIIKTPEELAALWKKFK